MLRSLIAAGIMVSVFTMPGQAASVTQDTEVKQDTQANQDTKAKKDKKAKQDAQVQVPIVVDAEEVYYNDGSGDMSAKGNVSIVQKNAKLYGDYIRGNTKQNEVWIDDEGIYVQDSTRLVGTATHYNYKERTGTIAKASGKIGHELVTGQQIDLQPQEVIIHDGTMTACPAKVPDYHVSASKVEIWPGDKLIAYNAKFWIKNKVIFTMAKYQKSLRKEDNASEFPRIGYSSRDGVSISQHLEYPLTDRLAAYADVAYYTKSKFKPGFGLIDREKNYTLNLTQGHYRDSDGNWVKKEPELRVDFASARVGNLPISYSIYGLYGKWTDTKKSSWHQDYNIYFTGDTIKLGNSAGLVLGTGFQHVRESYDNSVKNMNKYDATLYKTWSPNFSTWTAYHYTKNNVSLFEFNKADLARQFDVGFTYKIDRMNTLGFVQTYDVANNRIHDQDITWYRNLHCWDATVTYRVKRNEWKFDLATIRF